MLKRFRHCLSSNWKDITLIAILFLLPLACFADVVFLPYTFYRLDIELVQYPGKIFLTEMLKEGRLGFERRLSEGSRSSGRVGGSGARGHSA